MRLHYLKTIGKLVAIAALFFTDPFSLKGQMIGWPSSSSSAEVDFPSAQTISSNTLMDNNRAQVTAVSGPTGSPAQYSLTVSNATGTFTANKWCAIIQMAGSISTNNNCMVKVVSYSGTTLVVELLTGNTWPTLSLGGTYDRVQIVQIPIYWDLTLNGGEISCSPYDFTTGTGGFLPLIVGGGLTINGGYFSVSGKGYMNDWSGTPQLGIGGTGASPSAAALANFGGSPGGDPGQKKSTVSWGNICWGGLGPEPLLPNITQGNAGFAGDGEYCTGSTTGTSTANIQYYYPSTPTVSSPKTILRMGNAGTAGAAGGIGACAGGWGGNGGNSTTYFGAPGVSGGSGGNGGNAAQGAAGGGVMYIKLANTTINTYISNITTYKLFYADGGQGGNGGQGSNGGDGGRGGQGGDGDCSVLPNTLNTPGGWGGFGESGTGAGGGNAGKGGKPGTIWIVKGGATPALTRYMRVGGGIGGGGGRGGYSKRYIGNFSAKNYVPTSLQLLPCAANGWTFCTPPPGTVSCDRIVCDCDRIFKQWGDNGYSGVSYTPVGSNYDITFGNSAQKITYNTVGSKYLTFTELVSGCNITYHCYMSKQAQFEKMMLKAMGSTYPLQTYIPSCPTGATTSAYKISANASYNATTFKTSLIYTDPCSVDKTVFIYDPATNTLTDEDDITKPYVVAVNCNQTTSSGGTGNGSDYTSSGGTGEFEQFVANYLEKTGPDAADEPDEPDGIAPDNMDETASGAYMVPDPDKNQNGINTKNSPFIAVNASNSGLTLTLLKDFLEESTCNIYSMDGKLIGSQKIMSKELRFENIATGIYMVEIQSRNRTSFQKIIVDR